MFTSAALSYLNYSNQKSVQENAEIYDLIIENQHLIINATKHTDTFIKFLSDNFGSQSDYLQKENFQYAQANKTFEMIKQILNQTR